MLKKSEIRIFPDEIIDSNSGNYNSEMQSLFRPLIEKPKLTIEVRTPNPVDSYDEFNFEDIEPFPFTSSSSSYSIEDEFYDSSEEEFLIWCHKS